MSTNSRKVHTIAHNCKVSLIKKVPAGTNLNQLDPAGTRILQDQFTLYRVCLAVCICFFRIYFRLLSSPVFEEFFCYLREQSVG